MSIRPDLAPLLALTLLLSVAEGARKKSREGADPKAETFTITDIGDELWAWAWGGEGGK